MDETGSGRALGTSLLVSNAVAMGFGACGSSDWQPKTNKSPLTQAAEILDLISEQGRGTKSFPSAARLLKSQTTRDNSLFGRKQLIAVDSLACFTIVVRQAIASLSDRCFRGSNPPFGF